MVQCLVDLAQRCRAQVVMH
ncbi:hypothetical protein QWI29_06800 [Mycolicibacterium neoaurum]|nr:hypothetical protein [Mycolicibacterium neoaurum]MDO3399731.1 hypothetical protein [Mycolicibacterium neoaurum]